MLNISPFNMLCVALNMLILAVLMKKFLYKPVLGIIARRQELIDSQFAEAEAARKKAGQMKAEYEASLSDSKDERQRILTEARAEAAAEYDKILVQADEKARQMIEDARKISEDEKQKAMKDADSEIARLAAMAASKIVVQASGEENDSMIYEEFLKKAGEKSGTDRE